jgi:hypothetical protein
MILFIFHRCSLNLTNISLNSSFEISYDLLFLLHVVNNPKSFYDFISEFKIITTAFSCHEVLISKVCNTIKTETLTLAQLVNLPFS